VEGGIKLKWFPDRTTVCLSEVPGEISLSIVLAGCSHVCSGCHSTEYRDKNAGVEVDLIQYRDLLLKYKGKCSAVVFFNGEYDPEYLGRMAWAARLLGYGTALYSGFEFDELPEELRNDFTYIKTGIYIERLGGLMSPLTNQRLLKRVDGAWVNVTSSFQRSEV
jgi:anaerobic ribonucleoside-triphosphate reductase activating protein